MPAINPIIHADFPDPDVVRVGDTYYMISTAMHMFPGGQILRSYDLMHWEHCAYVYDILGETAHQRMDGGNIYARGMWAASLKYARGCFHAVFTSNDTKHSYYYTAERAEGPWTRQPMNGAGGAPAFWYDPGLLFDDDGRVYVAHGNRTIRLTELTADLSAKQEGGIDRVILQDSDEIMLGWEGSHLIKHDGWYYLFNIHWRRGGMRAMGCHRARSLTEDFTGGEFMELDLDDRHAGVAQGGPVQLHDGSWALFLFQDHGAVGRIPVVVPFRWEDGWPVVDEVPKQLDLPTSRPDYEYAPLYTSDDLCNGWSVLWQWNHEPHPELIDFSKGYRVTTDRLATNCTEAINTLTQRCFGPRCSAEVTVDGAALKVGDYAGLCALMGCFAQLAITRREDGLYLVYTRKDAESGEIIAEAERPIGSLSRLHARFDFTNDTVQFILADADAGWLEFGPPHQLVYRLDHFMGCRIGLFAYSTQEIGGSARFSGFTYRVEED